MPKPERILLQEKNQRNHATLANGVKCGEEAAFPVGLGVAGVNQREYIDGWGDYISLSGQLTSSGLPAGSDLDEIFRVTRVNRVNPEERGTGGGPFAGKRILGLMTNSVMPDLVRLVVDVGDDPSQPGQLECETVLLSARDLNPQLIETLQFLKMLPEDFKP